MASVTNSQHTGVSHFACDLLRGSLFSVSWFRDGSSFFWKQSYSRFQIDSTLLMVFEPTRKGHHPTELVSTSRIKRDCPLCRELHRECTCNSPLIGGSPTHPSWVSFVGFSQSCQVAVVPCTIATLDLYNRQASISRDMIHYGASMSYRVVSGQLGSVPFLSQLVPDPIRECMSRVPYPLAIDGTSDFESKKEDEKSIELQSDVLDVTIQESSIAITDSVGGVDHHYQNNLKHLRDPRYSPSDTRHICENCGKAFKRKLHLQNHKLAVHEKIRPHHCTICSLRFVTRSNLQRHIKSVHAGARDFLCAKCDFASARKSDLARHNRLVHRQ
mmetsp:Transcript_3221/g.6069  ORF Transcript_3221/g.6069 Transcript_3221/m.6069 type:complete len:329 (-) Transcript_3221:227-1213(-)